MPITEAGGPCSSAAPGKIPVKLEPTLEISPIIKLWAPEPIEIITTTAAMPIIMPSIVKKERILWARILRQLFLVLSTKFITTYVIHPRKRVGADRLFDR